MRRFDFVQSYNPKTHGNPVTVDYRILPSRISWLSEFTLFMLWGCWKEKNVPELWVWNWLAVLSLVAIKKIPIRCIFIWLLYPNILLGKQVLFLSKRRTLFRLEPRYPTQYTNIPNGLPKVQNAPPVLPRETHPENAWKWSYEPWNPSDHTWC